MSTDTMYARLLRSSLGDYYIEDLTGAPLPEDVAPVEDADTPDIIYNYPVDMTRENAELHRFINIDTGEMSPYVYELPLTSKYPDDSGEYTYQFLRSFDVPEGFTPKYRTPHTIWDPVTDDWIDDPDLALERARKHLAEYRFKLLDEGFAHIDGKWFHGDKDTLASMAGIVASSIVNGIIDVHWKIAKYEDQLDDVIEIPIGTFKKIKLAMQKYHLECFAKEGEYQAILNQSEYPLEVDVTQGWPNVHRSLD